MDALADANADATEVNDAIKIGGDVALGIDTAFDDAEIEKELEQLAREVEAPGPTNESSLPVQSRPAGNATDGALQLLEPLDTPSERPLPVTSEPALQRERVFVS
jgi:hypothetical protein